MKLIIAGSRDLVVSDSFLISAIYNTKLKVTEIVSGGASGIDTCAKQITQRKHSTDVFSVKMLDKFKEFPADWEKYGKAAGPIRNKEMAEYADALLLIWDGESRGSANMKQNMLKLNKPVYEVILKSYNV